MKLGFIGLGQMGKPMALNMHSPQDILTVYDVRAEAYPEFVAKGIATATNLAELADCEIVFLSLPDTPVVEKGVAGAGRLAEMADTRCDSLRLEYNRLCFQRSNRRDLRNSTRKFHGRAGNRHGGKSDRWNPDCDLRR